MLPLFPWLLMAGFDRIGKKILIGSGGEKIPGTKKARCFMPGS